MGLHMPLYTALMSVTGRHTSVNNITSLLSIPLTTLKFKDFDSSVLFNGNL